MEKKYVIIDLETTGNSPSKQDKIIEIGIVVIENDVITDEYSTYLNPGMSIPPFISNLTGITDNDVSDAPVFAEKANEITSFFDNSYLIAHNVPFDMGFLNEELALNGLTKLNNPVIDTVELTRILYPSMPSYKLGHLTDYFSIHHKAPHRALSDAFVTAELFLKLKQKLEKLPYETIAHLLRLEKMLKSNLYSLLQDQEQKLAFSYKQNDTFDTYRGLAFRHMGEESQPDKLVKSSFGSYLDAIYEADGAMQRELKNYEKRTGQRDMSEVIYDAFQANQHALIEAETGTGKTLAYLIPAIYESVANNKRIVISTYTTQLQSQLMDEEIPLIRKLIPFDFKIALLKGKQHYISLEKFERALADEQGDNYDIVLTKAMLLVWLTETKTGDIDEVQLPSSGYFFYNKIATDSESVRDTSSPWFYRSYYQRARIQAQQADVLITNHALMCTDIFNDYQIIPKYSKAIIDEAHHLEETASKHYGLKLDYVQVQFTLSQIGNTDKGKDVWRLLPEDLPVTKWGHQIDTTKNEVDELFRFLFQYVITQKQNEKSLSDVGRVQYRFEREKEEPKKWTVIKDMAARVIFHFRDLIQILSRTLNECSVKSNENDQLMNDIENIIALLQSIIDRLNELFLTDDTDTEVKWIEIEAYGAKNAVYLYSEPTDISSLLAEDFFSAKKSVVLTSATLTMKNSFSFMMKRLGLQENETITTKITSPFSYENQVQLMVPNDFPDIRYGRTDDFIHATCEAIMSLAEITNGRMLVLFTSYDMLRKSYYLLKEILDISQYMLIAQGISSGSRARLKKNFQTFDQAILLGTSSFWEGVDIPGEDLSCLMIVRLPFQPPNHPAYEAKSNRLKTEGKNAFFDLSLPNAVIRFKQGFGRLIRSASDRGIVFVCDARIVKAKYGKFFTKSIPDVSLTYDSTQSLMHQAKEWF